MVPEVSLEYLDSQLRLHESSNLSAPLQSRLFTHTHTHTKRKKKKKNGNKSHLISEDPHKWMEGRSVWSGPTIINSLALRPHSLFLDSVLLLSD